ncbi:hypothetical protein [Pseudonocardia sp. HH130629-09]|uniref:hypothetical protein n=1 Tax=Pseudonocardia sp. HH130629-09 TaxID=1641402 RepID=UPI0006CAFAC5|nr:hypothetical protein [Pseudonocardia sp. HH130629-09]ALE86604.1 hypothetical protein XF36_28730 [Pseudonocardia sp. HH130629-09]
MDEQPFPDSPAGDETPAAAPAAALPPLHSPVADGEDGDEAGAGDVAAADATGPAEAAWRARRGQPEVEPCQFPGGCANTMEYAGSGRRPKYCYQVVGGVMHDRVNAKRIADGGAPARRRGEPDDTLARPIARAGQTVTEQVATLIARLDEGGGELRDALGTLADPEAVAAEIAAARRAARAEVDAAQAATDEARAQARAGRDAADAARRSAAASDAEAADAVETAHAAEQARETAVAERDHARDQLAQTQAALQQQVVELTAERDAARADTDRVTTELSAQLDTLRVELTSAITERDTAAAARDTAAAEVERVGVELAALTRDHTRLDSELTEARRRVEQLGAERDTAVADLAATRQDRDRVETERTRLADELHDVREQAAEHRAARAGAESTLAAVREQLVRDVDRERAYGEQRLADADTRHTAQLAELRTDLARARGQVPGRTRRQDRDLDPDDNTSTGDRAADDPPATKPSEQAAAPRGARARRPRAAQRRPGPTATQAPAPTEQPGDTDAQE